MKYPTLSLCLGLFFALSAGAETKTQETLQLATSDFPPYQIQENEKLPGMNVEIVREVIKMAGYDSVLNFYPWARAIQIAQNPTNKNTIIFSVARNAEREKTLQWIGEVGDYKVYFWKLKERKDIVVHSMEDAKRYNVGGVIEDIRAAELKKLGFVENKNLEIVTNDYVNIEKLYNKHIDLIPFDESVFINKIKKSGKDFSKVEKLININELNLKLYMAASPSTPKKIVEDLSSSLKKFKRTKKYSEIRLKYLQL